MGTVCDGACKIKPHHPILCVLAPNLLTPWRNQTKAPTALNIISTSQHRSPNTYPSLPAICWRKPTPSLRRRTVRRTVRHRFGACHDCHRSVIGDIRLGRGLKNTVTKRTNTHDGDHNNKFQRDCSGLLGVTPPSSGRSSTFDDNRYQPSGQRFADDPEGQNDEQLEGLSAKDKLLKDITTAIGSEVRDSTVQISQMNDAFAETSGILSGTFRRMNNMAAPQGCRWLRYIVFLIVFHRRIVVSGCYISFSHYNHSIL